MFKKSKKWGITQGVCCRCKGSGKVKFCGKCGTEIYRYEDGIPYCDSCDRLLVGEKHK